MKMIVLVDYHAGKDIVFLLSYQFEETTGTEERKNNLSFTFPFRGSEGILYQKTPAAKFILAILRRQATAAPPLITKFCCMTLMPPPLSGVHGCPATPH